MKQLQYKQLECKALDLDKNRVKLALASFTNIDKVGDLIAPDAFDKTLKANPNKWHFLNHNPDKFAGKFVEMYTNNQYLIGIAELDEKNSTAKDLLLSYEKGEIVGHSIGYKLNDFVEEDDYYYLTEIDLWEGSSLTVPPANDNTPFLGFKALSNDQLMTLINDKRKSLEQSFLDKMSREKYALLKYKYLQLEGLLSKLFEKKDQEVTQTPETSNLMKDNTLIEFYQILNS